MKKYFKLFSLFAQSWLEKKKGAGKYWTTNEKKKVNGKDRERERERNIRFVDFLWRFTLNPNCNQVLANNLFSFAFIIQNKSKCFNFPSVWLSNNSGKFFVDATETELRRMPKTWGFNNELLWAEQKRKILRWYEFAVEYFGSAFIMADSCCHWSLLLRICFDDWK